MNASQQLIEYIKKTEALRLEAYKCPAGVWTIGYGHTKGVKQGDRITLQQAEQLLREDLAPAEAMTRKTRCATQGQFDAVCDFIYNCGAGKWQSSTLKKYIESGRKTWEIQEQFLRWVNAGGQKLGGLVSRRIWEAARYAE